MDVDRAMDRVLFAIVLLLPLLPSGPAYLGLEPGPWLQAAVIALLALATATWWIHRRKPAAAGGAPPRLLDRITAGWAVFLAAAIGAAIVGLAADNDLASPLFRYNLQEAGRLLWPVDRAWDPLYPLQPALVIALGLLAYAAVRALCLWTDAPRRRARAVLQAWAYGFGLVGAFALLQYFTGFRLHPFWVAANPDLTRSHATLDDPNALGSYLVLGILLCAGLATARSGRRAAATALLAGLGVAALLTSASRAAIGGLALATLATAALPGGTGESAARARWRRGARWLLAAGAIVLVVSVLARFLVDFAPLPYRPGNVVSAVAGVFDPRIPLTKSLENRGMWWDAALRMAQQAPLLGVGLGRFPRLLPEYAPQFGNLDAHNYFLQVLAEMGLLGLLAFGALLAAVFVTLTSLRRDSEAPKLAAAVLLGSIAYVATLLTGHPLLLVSGQVLWATLLAAVVVVAQPDERFDERAQPRGQGADAPSAPAPRAPTAGRTALLCAAILAVYSVGALRSPSFVPPPDWGYSYGLYAQETGADGRRYRWTGGLALLQLPAPPDATALRVEVAVSPALRAGQATRVSLSLDRNGTGSDAPDRRDFNIRRISQPGSYAVELRLAPDHRFGRYVLLRIEVEPIFVPADEGESHDRRELGVQLFEPTFEGDAR